MSVNPQVTLYQSGHKKESLKQLNRKTPQNKEKSRNKKKSRGDRTPLELFLAGTGSLDASACTMLRQAKPS